MKRVVVTGIGALTPIGNDVASYTQALKEGVSGAKTITRFDASQFKTTFACELKDYDPSLRIEKKAIRKLDRFSQYALSCADEAIEDSGLDLDKVDKSRIGVIWGSGIGGLRSLEAEIEYNSTSSTPRYNPFMIPKMISDMAPSHISMKYGFTGMLFGAVSACASASHAIQVCCDQIRLGREDVMISGGSEASITKAGLGGFSFMKAMSQRNDDPATASRPFDKDRDGFVLGEGGAAVVLESYEHARKRGAKIYAEILGCGSSADAYHITAPEPQGIGVVQAIKRTLADAAINPSDIDYINVHGTSTPLGDIAELIAIEKVFKESSFDLAISSTKSMTGHLLGAAGAIEIVACIIALQHGFVPPTINHHTADPEIDPKFNLTLNTAQEKSLNHILCNTFGFGGKNACIVIGKV